LLVVHQAGWFPIRGAMEPRLPFYFWKVYVTLDQLILCQKKQHEKNPSFEGLQPNTMPVPEFEPKEL